MSPHRSLYRHRVQAPDARAGPLALGFENDRDPRPRPRVRASQGGVRDRGHATDDHRSIEGHGHLDAPATTRAALDDGRHDGTELAMDRVGHGDLTDHPSIARALDV